MKTIPILLATLLFLTFSPEVPAQKYVSKTGNFSIVFPGTPDESSQDVETELGVIKMYSIIYTPAGGSPVYMVAYCDYPEEAIKVSQPRELLNNAMDGYLNSLEMKMEKSKEVQLNKKYNGIYFEGKSTQYSSRNYNYIVGCRLYQVAILNIGNYLPQKEYDSFFKSFKLVQ